MRVPFHFSFLISVFFINVPFPFDECSFLMRIHFLLMSVSSNVGSPGEFSLVCMLQSDWSRPVT